MQGHCDSDKNMLFTEIVQEKKKNVKRGLTERISEKSAVRQTKGPSMDNTEMQFVWGFSACTLGCGKSKKMTKDVQGGSSVRGADKQPDIGRKRSFSLVSTLLHLPWFQC